MLDGKMLRGLTGTPMRRIDLAKSSFADAEPEPFTLANLITKSLTARIGSWSGFIRVSSGRPDQRAGRGLRTRRTVAGGARSGMGHLDQELLHVPGTGGAALGAQPAVQAHVLVLHHHALGLERLGDVEILVRVEGGRGEPGAQDILLGIRREGDAVHRADVHAGVALDALRAGEDRLDVAVEAAPRLGERELGVEA